MRRGKPVFNGKEIPQYDEEEWRGELPVDARQFTEKDKSVPVEQPVSTGLMGPVTYHSEGSPSARRMFKHTLAREVPTLVDIPAEKVKRR